MSSDEKVKMSNAEKPSSSNSIDEDLPFPPSPLVEEFDRAMKLCEKNPKKALGIAESMCAKYGEFSLAHFCRGKVLAEYACSLNDDAKNKPKVWKSSLESLHKSMSLEPLPTCSYLIAIVLFELASDDEGYAKVVQECERGLSMVDSFDPMKEEATNKFQDLMKLAKEGQEFKNQRSTEQNNMAPVERRREFLVGSTDDSEISREEEKSNQEFVKRVGAYWRNLHYYQKCRMMQVEVADLEEFYLSGENRNLRAVNIMKDAIENYRKKKHWVTWSCCLCKEDENEWKYENWSSIATHIHMRHFDGTPKVEGIFDAHEIIGVLDPLDMVYLNDDDDYTSAIFKFDMMKLVGRIDSDAVVNNKFLTKWLRKDYDVERAFESWEERRVSSKDKGIKISEHVDKEMQETTASSQASPSNKLNRNVANIVGLKQDAVLLSTYDYREILVPLLKYYIQGRLEREVEIARAEADAAMAELLKEFGLDKENEPNTSKKKKRKQKEKGTDSSEHKSEQSLTSITDNYLEHSTKASSPQEELVAGVQLEKEDVAEDKLEEERGQYYPLGRIQFGTITPDILNRINQRNIGE